MRASSWFVLTGTLALAVGAFVAADGGAPALAADESPAARSARDVAADVDRLVAAAWAKEGVKPNPRCSDEEFVRRAYLDLVGTIPTAPQAEDFLKDASPDKRARLVDDLLASPGFARHFANQWADVLVGVSVGDDRRDFVAGLFLPWLERQMATGRPYGEWVTELLTAKGTAYTNPAVNYAGRKDHSPSDLAGAVSKAFLGVQIQCAQCHDHPYEDITQKDFESFSAFWGRVRLKPADIPFEMFGPRAVEQEQKRVQRAVDEMVKQGIPEGEARIRAERQKVRTREVDDIPGGTPVPKALLEGRMKGLGEAAKAQPKFLKGPTYADRAGETRREALARWITDPANPYTAKAFANRVWGWFLGRGIVHPVDDFSSVNVPSVPGALDVLAADAAANGFDLRRAIRIVTATRAYQTSTASKDRPAKAQEVFAAGPLKPLTSQQSFDSLNVALGVVADGRALTLAASGPTALEMEDGRGGMARMMMGTDYEQPGRAQVLMAQAARSFFRTFEDDEGNADASFEGTVPQGLFLMNSPVVNGMLSNPRASVVPRIVANWKDERDRIRQLFLRTLSREPRPDELARFSKFVRDSAAAPAKAAGGKARRGRADEDQAAAAYADALWVLVSSSEFGSNH
jgi:hypothetical protein